ncbi:glycosyltransferase [Clostridium sp.]|jgi:glycosyltransferase involved in cell wall biosynthesis|uniref:glycosyltransferase n=1 Tax=Clostridium sp. TaxID=1506 RepID=UPI00291569FD|nr:glycosyltransferase [Clostridium sp.]MDU7363114.1 glycosyltransferase [Clostridium sp.]
MESKITAHMIVRNEDKWIWFSIMSIINYVDKIIIFDTGSDDNTIEIIKNFLENEIYKNKIYFEEKGKVSKESFYKLRQEQIDMTETKYFMVVDGDEIWFKDSMSELVELTQNEKYELIATKFINVAGDIYHYRDFNRETYNIKGICGSITIRVYSMDIKGIKCAGEYGVEGYYDFLNIPVQESNWSIGIMENKYLHTSLLKRSSKITGDIEIHYRRKKLFAEYDYKFSDDYKYPEVFYLERPECVESPFQNKMDLFRKLINRLRRIKRKLLKGGAV